MKAKSKERILFNQFLKDNNCLRQFVRNYKNDIQYLGLNECLEVKHPEKYISSSFHWIGTPEGVRFWMDLHYSWIKLLKTIP
jgi:hypothetical protein